MWAVNLTQKITQYINASMEMSIKMIMIISVQIGKEVDTDIYIEVNEVIRPAGLEPTLWWLKVTYFTIKSKSPLNNNQIQVIQVLHPHTYI